MSVVVRDKDWRKQWLKDSVELLDRILSRGRKYTEEDAKPIRFETRGACDKQKFSIMVHRQREHVMTFLLDEMRTRVSLDGQQRLVVKGRFGPKFFEGILRRYVNKDVICNGCKSPDTIFSKENRLILLRREKLGTCELVSDVKRSRESSASPVINRTSRWPLRSCLSCGTQ
ncbi:hypothetical protein Vadar_008989 [Vaccinium darrowii]|uniref:Uncharacterized protein n=1 Tax=Vaccinium darrowii TaxID=229202 RepID=A0ACB7YV00_9ERIC|nr:hypothetical protein Vadar_008989 [Vaccinium darrowii]